jgi:hypothetical protein
VVLKTVSTLGATGGGGGGGGVSSVTATSPLASSGGATPDISLTGTVPVAKGGTGVTVSTGPNSVVLRDASNNITANAYFNSFNSITASGTAITLTVASAPVQYVSGSGGQTIKLPDATTLLNGTIFSFNNNQSSGAITVNNNSNTLVVSVPSGAYVTVVLLSNATAAGSWDRHDQTPSNTSWSTNTLDYPGSITSATWNGATVQVNRGGTGLATIPAGNVVIGNGTSALYGLAPGTAGNVLTSIGGAWVSNAAVGGGGTPGGSTTQFQYNNGGAFAGAANLTTDGANTTIGSANTFRFANLTSATYVGLKANAIVAANVTWTLPVSDGTSGQVLKTDGSGNLSWTSTLPASGPSSVEYLVVAGGGGGGTYVSGGGGAGGLLTTTGYTTAVGTSYTVTVGAGAAARSSTIGVGNSGSNSVFGTGTVTNSAATSGSITSVGGGAGATGGGTAGAATTGGSGGGGGSSSSTAGAAGTSGQGNSGGNSPGAVGNYVNGGGGGASAVGVSPATSVSPGGNGGAGNTYTTGTSITGLADSYAGGGGGATSNSGTAGTGGTGGGGNGTVYNSSASVVTIGTAGTVNTGGGSGGGGVNASSSGTSLAGGSGVVIIAYLSTFADLTFVASTLTSQSWNGSAWVNNSAGSTTPNTTIRSGYKVYRFSAGTGVIYW